MRVEQPLEILVPDLQADPADAPEWLGDIVALGGEVTAASMLSAYAAGTFPMEVGLADSGDDDDCLCDECVAETATDGEQAVGPQAGIDIGGPTQSSPDVGDETDTQGALSASDAPDAPDASAASILAWWSPVKRAVLPLSALRVSRSLAKSCRRYEVTVDRDFAQVLRECADPRDNSVWMLPDFIAAYEDLHAQGKAHSVETRDSSGRLVGGLICVEQGGLVNGDSMFHRERDASKVALVALVRMLREAPPAPGLPEWIGGRLLDAQWLTPHLASLGAVEITRRDYVRLLPAALAVAPAIGSPR